MKFPTDFVFVPVSVGEGNWHAGNMGWRVYRDAVNTCTNLYFAGLIALLMADVACNNFACQLAHLSIS